MRHFTLTALSLTALLLSSCAEGPQNEVPTSEFSASELSSTPAVQNAANQAVTIMETPASLAARYKDLDPRDISQADITEHQALQAKQAKASEAYQIEIQAWAQQNPASRGPQPVWDSATLSPEDTERLSALNTKVQIAEMRKRYQGFDPRDITQVEVEELIELHSAQIKTNQAFQQKAQAWYEQDASRRGPQPEWQEVVQNTRLMDLNTKVQLAEIRKKYENFDSNILSTAEVEEIISLEQAQVRKSADYQTKLTIWTQEDEATRGPQPQMDPDTYMGGQTPRMQALQAKVQGAQEAQRFAARVNKLSKTHNISISDSELSELTALQTEQKNFQTKMNKAMMEAANSGQFDGRNPAAAIQNMPKDVLQRMFDVGIRIEAIEAPIKAAEKAESVRAQLTHLSENSGIPILSSEIEETIALDAEKVRIENRSRREAGEKWLAEGGSITLLQQPLLTPADYARVKEIDARMKAISAPMIDAQNAAQEAKNPVMKQYRLAQEEREKWETDWQDRKQAGEFPADAQINSPTYAELQDRAETYRADLQSRADEAGYQLSASELRRLEALNNDMLDIRKSVYDMEVDGSTMVEGVNGFKTQAFGLTAGMYKIVLIDQKQREILAGLTQSEMRAAADFGESQIRAPQFIQSDHGVVFSNPFGGAGAEAVIQSSRARGVEVSQSEEDDLRAFAQELADR